jgi:ABC-type uncharacterized transport system permease subunit
VISLERRTSTSSVWLWASPFLAVVLTSVSGLIIFALLGKDPVEGFQVFFLNPISSFWAVMELLLKATPLALCAIGLAIGFRAGIWNIGAEGQFIVGAIFATGIALYVGDISGVSLVAMILAGTLGGMVWAAIPAFLKSRFNANEILVSLMLVYVAQLLVSWLVFGPWKDPMGFNFPQTIMFDSESLLPTLVEGQRLNLAFVFMMGLLVLAHVFMNHSRLGFAMRTSGEAPLAALYAGFSNRQGIYLGMLAGGACAGLAGMAEVAGPVGQLTDKMSLGYGFAAIIVAFVGRLNALGILFASLVMALFYVGGEQAQQYLNLPSAMSRVFQGMLLFYLLAADVFVTYRLVLGSANAGNQGCST